MNNMIIGLGILCMANIILLIIFIRELNMLSSRLDVSMYDVQKRFDHSQDFFDNLLDYLGLEIKFTKPTPPVFKIGKKELDINIKVGGTD